MSVPQLDLNAMSSRHDVELAALSASGDRRAFGELARRHGSGVRALLRRLGADAALADDLAQDAFLAAFESIQEFRGEGAFGGWVKRIAARLYLRRRRRRIDLQSAEPLDPDWADHVSLGPDSRLDLDSALAALSPSERLCVTLSYGAGLSHGEVSEALGCPLGTVKSHVKRGLDKLKRRLAPAADDITRSGRRTVG